MKTINKKTEQELRELRESIALGYLTSEEDINNRTIEEAYKKADKYLDYRYSRLPQKECECKKRTIPDTASDLKYREYAPKKKYSKKDYVLFLLFIFLCIFGIVSLGSFVYDLVNKYILTLF